jgi:xylan 1,4-beta-xylosidase
MVYSFFNTDQIFDFLLSIDMKPFVELSFMPSTLSSGDDIVFKYKANVSPPRDMNAWNVLIGKLVTHWVERYGIEEVGQWFFEVWNEPNLDAFWKGTQAQYFDLYLNTANTIKKVNAAIKVGGPATADNDWIPAFLDFCEKNNAPVDFVSTHHYPTDSFGKPGDDTITQLSESERSALQKEARLAQTEARGKPLYYTEWCTSSNPFDELHDLPYAAAFITKTIIEAQGLVSGYSYWTFSDIFEENYFSSVPFHGGFGLMNIYGIPKPAYRAFELLHKIGDTQLTVDGKHDTVDVWIFKKGNAGNIISTNWALPRHDIKTETVRIQLQNGTKIKNVTVQYIDDNNSNATKGWKEMGSPESLIPKQVAVLESKSQLVAAPLEVHTANGNNFIEITLSPQATASVTFEVYE